MHVCTCILTALSTPRKSLSEVRCSQNRIACPLKALLIVLNDRRSSAKWALSSVLRLRILKEQNTKYIPMGDLSTLLQGSPSDSLYLLVTPSHFITLGLQDMN